MRVNVLSDLQAYGEKNKAVSESIAVCCEAIQYYNVWRFLLGCFRSAVELAPENMTVLLCLNVFFKGGSPAFFLATETAGLVPDLTKNEPLWVIVIVSCPAALPSPASWESPGKEGPQEAGRGKKGAQCFWQLHGLHQFRLGEAFTLGLCSCAHMGKISALEGIAGLQVRPCSCLWGVQSYCKGGYWSWADLFCVLQKLCNFRGPLLNIVWAVWTTAVSEGIGRGISICQCSTWAPTVLLWRCDGFGCMILASGGTLAQLKVH